MNIKRLLHILSAAALLSLFVTGCSQPPPQTAGEVLERSVGAHGGEALTNWESMVIKGETDQNDLGQIIRSDYQLFAQKPGKVRVEIDQTKYERGRMFSSYIYNDGTGWMIRNLIPNYRPEFSEQFKPMLNQCDGIGYYAQNAENLTLEPEEEVNERAAYVVTAVIGSDTTKLYIDKDNFYFLKEETGDRSRTYSDFKKLGGVRHATTIDMHIGGSRPQDIPYRIISVEYNIPVEARLFEEDRPATAEK